MRSEKGLSPTGHSSTPAPDRARRGTTRRLPAHRYPGYYRLSHMVVERAVGDWVAGAFVKTWRGRRGKRGSD
jgi:hypothetical protein